MMNDESDQPVADPGGVLLGMLHRDLRGGAGIMRHDVGSIVRGS